MIERFLMENKFVLLGFNFSSPRNDVHGEFCMTKEVNMTNYLVSVNLMKSNDVAPVLEFRWIFVTLDHVHSLLYPIHVFHSCKVITQRAT